MKRNICTFLVFITVICAFFGCVKPDWVDPSRTQSDYPYSHITLTSGNSAIQPLQAELWSEVREKKGIEAYCADSPGARIFIDDKYLAPDGIPNLVLNGEVALDIPDGVTYIGNPRIYDTDFQILDTAPQWSELHLLGKGEYFVVFTEVWDVENAAELRNSDAPFARYGYENLFMLTVEK